MSNAAEKLERTEGKFQVPLGQLHVKPGFNPRDVAEPDEELTGSIKAAGVQEDIHVWRRPEGGFWILEGERRYKAAKKVRPKDNVPIQIHEEIQDDNLALLTALVLDKKKNLTDSEKAKAYKRLCVDGDAEEKDVALNLGMSVRSLKEQLAIDEKAVPEIQTGAKAKSGPAAIPRRAAARAAGLPAAKQREIAPKLRGKNTKEAVRTVQNAEKEIERKRPGRKAADLGLRRDANRQVTTLFHMVGNRLVKSPTDLRAQAHMEVLLIMLGKNEVIDLYDGDAKASKKLLTPAGVREIVSRFNDERAARVENEKAAAAKPKAKKATKKTVKKPAKKATKKAAKKAKRK